MDPLKVFRWRRSFALAGLGAGGLCVCFALLNGQQHLVTTSLDWPLAGFGLGLVAVLQWNYRCPYCGKRPEPSDVPTFDPATCGSCGARLK